MLSKFLRTDKKINVVLTNILVYANVYVALASVALLLVTYIVFSIPKNYDSYSYVLFIFLSTYLQYNVQRGYMINASNANSERSQWLMKHRKLLLYSIVASLIVVLFLCNNLSYTSIGIMVGAEVVSTAYYLPPFNMRKYGYIKPFLIALVWVVSCCLVPLLENNLLSAEAYWFIAAQFFFISTLCLLFDVKDIEYDYYSGVNTYANKLGLTKTKIISIGVLLLSAMSFYMFSKNVNYQLAYMTSLIMSAVTVLITTENKSHLFYYLWIDGLMLLQGLLFIVTSYM